MKNDKNTMLLKKIKIRLIVSAVFIILSLIGFAIIGYFIHERKNKIWIYIVSLIFILICFILSFLSLVGPTIFYKKNYNRYVEDFKNINYLKFGLFYVDIITKINNIKQQVKEKNPSLQIEYDREYTDEQDLH